jgi:hypothetical protein
MRALAIVHQPDAGPGVFAEALEADGVSLDYWTPIRSEIGGVNGAQTKIRPASGLRRLQAFCERLDQAGEDVFGAPDVLAHQLRGLRALPFSE